MKVPQYDYMTHCEIPVGWLCAWLSVSCVENEIQFVFSVCACFSPLVQVMLLVTWLGVFESCQVLFPSSKSPLTGSGCMHCTDVPCQLRVASVHDTNACGCSISILSTDTILGAFSLMCGRTHSAILS